jgi:hypothetical protein
MYIYTKDTENEDVVFAVREIGKNKYDIVQIRNAATTHYIYEFDTDWEAIEFVDALVDAYNDGYLDGIYEE